MFFKLSIFYIRFLIFRRCVDAEMKDSTRQGVSLQTKKEEKEAVTDEDESITDTKKEAQKILFLNASSFTNCDKKTFVNEKKMNWQCS